jgi:hypothetical protein
VLQEASRRLRDAVGNNGDDRAGVHIGVAC